MKQYGKEHRSNLDLATMGDTSLAQARKIDLIAVDLEAVHCQALTMGLEPRGTPIRHHSSHHLEPATVAAAGARIISADGRPAGKLAATMARSHPGHMIVGRMKVGPL
jgi:hypothetical protein